MNEFEVRIMNLLNDISRKSIDNKMNCSSLWFTCFGPENLYWDLSLALVLQTLEILHHAKLITINALLLRICLFWARILETFIKIYKHKDAKLRDVPVMGMSRDRDKIIVKHMPQKRI